VYNPEALVSALKLDKGEQQDAQEFSKLFMSLLDHEFKKQGLKRAAEGGSPDVAKLVQTQVGRVIIRVHSITHPNTQFEGSITYGTKCSSCQTKSERNSTFLELEVNLTVRQSSGPDLFDPILKGSLFSILAEGLQARRANQGDPQR
jgi:hypothetical protein